MEDNGLRPLNRYITTHDANGVTGFQEQLPDSLQWQQLANGARFSLGYATNEIPVELSDDKDLDVYQSYLKDLPGITIPGGTVLRVVDMNPASISPMHRTVSLDYGVVLEGEVELVLDSGATRLLKRGDIAVQRGTNHAWRNPSKTTWARMLYVLQEAKPIQVNGKDLEEDYGGGMDDVRPSK
ncbi:Putative Cupin domain containing protein [Aspergillus calidoustus]|uniref:Putative Cupin domain containing protein n=1 Tax=Aspergillus calidoustus TaxID=454130 RepID=A0A0U5FWA8_ASPCI|nr:Putative Cupin domain containing protein [Aspergillus calidoustus]